MLIIGLIWVKLTFHILANAPVTSDSIHRTFLWRHHVGTSCSFLWIWKIFIALSRILDSIGSRMVGSRNIDALALLGSRNSILAVPFLFGWIFLLMEELHVWFLDLVSQALSLYLILIKVTLLEVCRVFRVCLYHMRSDDGPILIYFRVYTLSTSIEHL